MTKHFRLALCFLLPSLLFFAISCKGEAGAQNDSTPQIVDFLINTVAQSHLTFIRNGESHACDVAAGHIKKKYDYFRSEVKTPADFIRLCASGSILSGKPYLVVTQQGPMPVSKWLEQKLAEYLKTQTHPEPQ